MRVGVVLKVGCGEKSWGDRGLGSDTATSQPQNLGGLGGSDVKSKKKEEDASVPLAAFTYVKMSQFRF